MVYLVTLGVAALLGIIPGKIAEQKGHSFWLLWFYGWMSFIVAIIHVNFIEDLNHPAQKMYTGPANGNQGYYYNPPANNVPVYNNVPQENTVVSNAEELKKYKELLDMGAITEDEYNAAKKRLLNI